MKIAFIFSLLLISLNVGCTKSADPQSSSSSDTTCGTYKSGQQLYKGSEGGCYYFNTKGNKTYVERSACTCN